MFRITSILSILFLMQTIAYSQARTDKNLEEILLKNTDPLFRQVLNDPTTYRLQIIYTEINRDKKNSPSFTNYYFNYDPKLYFNPASMVKMPLAFLSLEKLKSLRGKGLDKYTPMKFEKSKPWQTALELDTTARDHLPTIAHFIKRAFLISENDPYNRMYQFLGQGQINQMLHEKGYTDTRITRQFLGLTPEQNRHTNAIAFTDQKGKVIYSQPAAYNTDSFDFSQVIKLGRAHMDRKDSLINEPFDFTMHNYISLFSMQQMLQSVLFPKSVPAKQRFKLNKDDYRFLYRYLSQYPAETPDPKYDETVFYDSYVKFFFRDQTKKMPPGIRVFNKVGWSYGFITDVSYVADFNSHIEYMLSATIYVNSDGILNDNKYEYDSIGYPFLYQLGSTIYQHELQRKRAYQPDLSSFKMEYEKRDPDDKRKPLKDVDN